MTGRSLLRVSALLLFAAVVFAGCGSSTDGDDVAASAAPPAEALRGDFVTLAGSQIDLNALQGQDVVLWFWAPW